MDDGSGIFVVDEASCGRMMEQAERLSVSCRAFLRSSRRNVKLSERNYPLFELLTKMNQQLKEQSCLNGALANHWKTTTTTRTTTTTSGTTRARIQVKKSQSSATFDQSSSIGRRLRRNESIYRLNFTVMPQWIDYFSTLATVTANFNTIHTNQCRKLTIFMATSNHWIPHRERLKSENIQIAFCIYGKDCPDGAKANRDSFFGNANAMVDPQEQWIQFRNVSYVANGDYLLKCAQHVGRVEKYFYFFATLKIGVRPRILSSQIEFLPETIDGDRVNEMFYPLREVESKRRFTRDTPVIINGRNENFKIIIGIGKGFDLTSSGFFLNFTLANPMFDYYTFGLSDDERPIPESAMVIG